MLHRAHHGPENAGDWAWTPPAGARRPGEPVDACARRELREETGLERAPEPTPCGREEWSVYLAEASPDATVVIDAEHDGFEWLPVHQARARCAPELAPIPLAAVIEHIGQRP